MQAIPDGAVAFREARNLLVDIVSATAGDRISVSRLLAELDQRPDSSQKAALRRGVVIVEEARFLPGDFDDRLTRRLLSALAEAIEATSIETT